MFPSSPRRFVDDDKTVSYSIEEYVIQLHFTAERDTVLSASVLGCYGTRGWYWHLVDRDQGCKTAWNVTILHNEELSCPDSQSALAEKYFVHYLTLQVRYLGLETGRGLTKVSKGVSSLLTPSHWAPEWLNNNPVLSAKELLQPPPQAAPVALAPISRVALTWTEGPPVHEAVADTGVQACPWASLPVWFSFLICAGWW